MVDGVYHLRRFSMRPDLPNSLFHQGKAVIAHDTQSSTQLGINAPATERYSSKEFPEYVLLPICVDIFCHRPEDNSAILNFLSFYSVEILDNMGISAHLKSR